MAHKIVIAGGTGFLGRSIINYLQQQTDIKIIVLTRGHSKKNHHVSYVHWDAKTAGDWINEIEESTAVINLVGKSVNCRYTTKNKQEIIASRVDATVAIGQAIQQLRYPPKVWINAGSAAIFGDGGDIIKDENSAVGDGFSAEVCKIWEKAFLSIDTIHTRKVFLRIGLVFQKNTGLLQPFANLVKTGFGGAIGKGDQYTSWIHEDDFVNVIYAALENEDYEGVIHCASPYPVTNKHFMTALRSSLNRSFGFSNPALFVKLGAFFIGTEAELVLKGRRVVSTILKEKNFVFQYPQIEDALQHLLSSKQVYTFAKQ
ncbi:MAG: TIGR01777 family protein [Ferruginibacter sp.]|nr:TIGR01777 family protein [Ferruginibacter sp.]